ncbi:NmrA family NAD(P)-binding protein [Streptomyces brasiliscabiei]|uniref:NmrA family NAD(P)-binding protein n=1 Tax=Streptomyces brasiliscabiei TaxID=2736302 RepID=UPI001C112535|nr:NAD(P)H-binding protein [Streptomyces brasiliscabiei]
MNAHTNADRTYVVHGATGAQGAPVAAALAAGGASVTALTRNPDAVVAGARVRPVDVADADQLAAAYRDADGVFVHLPISPDPRTHARAITRALGAARPARVVFSTSGGIAPRTDGGTDAGTEPDAVADVMAWLKQSGLSYAVVSPRLFLENLLLPPIQAAVHENGSLPYPLRADLPVSWVSHLDMADIVAALFERTDVTGVVEAGQSPGTTGPHLAASFSAHLGRSVAFDPQTTDAFRDSMAPLIGAGAAAGVAAMYAQAADLAHLAIDPARSAQHLLGLSPRTTVEWLKEVSL